MEEYTEITCPTCGGTGKIKKYTGSEYANNPEADVNHDGHVNVVDMGIIRQGWNWNKRTYPEPVTEPTTIYNEVRVSSGMTIENLIIDLRNTNSIGIRTTSDTDNVTIRNVEVIGGYYGVLVNFDHHHTNWTFENVKIHGQSNKGIWIGCDGLSMKNVSVYDTGSHGYRPWFLRNATHTNCSFTGNHALKLHCAAQSGEVASEDISFTDCMFTGTGDWTCTVGTQDQYNPEITRRVLFDNCTFDHTYQIGLRVSAQDVTIRNCKSVNSTVDWSALCSVELWGVEPPPTGCRIEGCTSDTGIVVKRVWTDTVIV